MKKRHHVKLIVSAMLSVLISLSNDASFDGLISSFIAIYTIFTVWGLVLSFLLPGFLVGGIAHHKHMKSMQNDIKHSITGCKR